MVLLKGGGSCKGCGAGKIGLCRAAGDSMMLTVKNDIGARPGDLIQIGIDRGDRRRGFLLAYVVPMVSFVAGALTGNVTGDLVSFRGLDVLAGFAALFGSSFLTYRRLRDLDRSTLMTVKRIIAGDEFREEVPSEEEKRYMQYAPRY